MVADDVWYKEINMGGGLKKYEVVLVKTKLSNAAPFTENQEKLMQQLASTPPNINFELSSTRFSDEQIAFSQGAKLEVKAFVKTEGNGATASSGAAVEKDFKL